MHPTWKPFLNSEFTKPYFKELSAFLKTAYAQKQIFPPKPYVFRAFTTDLNDVKVVILGQDPYHTPGIADGLAFSNRKVIPPSLKNIYQEIDSDLTALLAETSHSTPLPEEIEKNPNLAGRHANPSGDLTPWQKQGILLLNNVLTVEAHRAGSHRGKGWETFTEACIKYLNAEKDHLVFILWGADARRKKSLIDTTKHLVLESSHPSPLSAHSGFFGSRPFSKTNAFLKQHNLSEIIW